MFLRQLYGFCYQNYLIAHLNIRPRFLTAFIKGDESSYLRIYNLKLAICQGVSHVHLLHYVPHIHLQNVVHLLVTAVLRFGFVFSFRFRIFSSNLKIFATQTLIKLKIWLAALNHLSSCTITLQGAGRSLHYIVGDFVSVPETHHKPMNQASDGRSDHQTGSK